MRRLGRICGTWSTDANNQSLSGNGDVIVTVVNGGAANDSLTVTSGTCTLHVGTINLGSTAYVTANQGFSGNGSNKSTVTWTASSRTLTITLGAGTASSPIASSTATYTPDAAITSSAGVAISGTASIGPAPLFSPPRGAQAKGSANGSSTRLASTAGSSAANAA
jgi:hypothetical protein